MKHTRTSMSSINVKVTLAGNYPSYLGYTYVGPRDLAPIIYLPTFKKLSGGGCLSDPHCNFSICWAVLLLWDFGVGVTNGKNRDRIARSPALFAHAALLL